MELLRLHALLDLGVSVNARDLSRWDEDALLVIHEELNILEGERQRKHGSQ